MARQTSRQAAMKAATFFAIATIANGFIFITDSEHRQLAFGLTVASALCLSLILLTTKRL